VFFSARFRSRSLGITMSASTCFLSSTIPSSALRFFISPSYSKGLVTTRHRERAPLAGDLRDDRRAAGPRSAAHAAVTNTTSAPARAALILSAVLQRGLSPDLRIGPGAHAAGDPGAQEHLDQGLRLFPGLAVGVRGNELNHP